MITPRKPGIYLITVISCNKKYIGSTINLRSREQSYKCFSGLPSLIRSAGHTINDIKFEVIEVFEDILVSLLRDVELKYIESYDTFYPNGFNLNNPVTGRRITTKSTKAITNRIRTIDNVRFISMMELATLLEVKECHILYLKS